MRVLVWLKLKSRQTLSLWSSLRLQLGYFGWPVTVMTNVWQTSESLWNPPKLPQFLFPVFTFYDTETKQTLMQRPPPPHCCPDSGQQPCYKLAAYVWHPDKYLRHLLSSSMPSHTCGNSTAHPELPPSYDSQPSLKSMDGTGRTWSLLTE